MTRPAWTASTASVSPARSLLLSSILLVVATQPGLLAQVQEPDVRIGIHASHLALPAGGSGMLGIVLQVPDGFHIQVNDFLSAAVLEPEGIRLGPLALPPAQDYDGDPVYKGRAVFKAPLSIDASVPPGPRTVKVQVGYQGCAEVPVFVCFPPSEFAGTVALEVLPSGSEAVANRDAGIRGLGLTESAGGDASSVGASAAAGSAAAAGAAGGLAARVEQALARGSWLAFLLVFAGGIAMSFTPCVYPMIPITVSYVGGRSRGRLNGFVLSIFFVLGIAITYAALGLFAAQTGALFGSAMQSTWVLLLVAAVLAIMGASMLGAFDIALPSSMQTRLQSGARRGGFVGAILMGMVTGLVASPCVGPVLIVLLTWVAKAGDLLLGFWLLFTFAAGLGMLFLVIGTFAGAVSALPRSGEWMNTVKHVFGVILIGMGFYYLKPVVGESIFWLLLGAFTIFVASFTGAFHRLPEAPSWGAQFRKGLGMLLLVAGILTFTMGMLRALDIRLAAPDLPVATRGAPRESGLVWLATDDQALARAQASRRPVLLDFYADWCAACKELDEKTWSHPQVAAELERFVLAKLDYTKPDPRMQKTLEEYGVQGLPTVILLDSRQNEVRRFAGYRGPQEVLEMLRAVG